MAGFERLGPLDAELALLISDRSRHQGIGTLLMEHLADRARRQGIHRFVAEILAQNVTMLRAVRSLGFPTTAHAENEVVRLTFDLDGGRGARAAIGDRERRADAASLGRLLSPRTVALLGAGEAGSVGFEVLRNILEGGFTGTIEVVDPEHDSMLGVPTLAGVADLSRSPDLAILAVPAVEVPAAVQACGQHGAAGVLILTSGFGEAGIAGAEVQREVGALARRHGMRVIGPNCLGLVNTDPAVRLNATFAQVSMIPGTLGLVSQSGALGAALMAEASLCGLHVSQFVSVGNKADVSSNDLLLTWEQDERVAVIALYLESFGNPRRFARIARRVAGIKPVIALKAGRSLAGQRAGLSHTASSAEADLVVDALFAQAGVLRVDTMQQLLDLARVLTDQPLVTGPRVAIIGDSGGARVIAADAAVAAGLTVVQLTDATVRLLLTAAPTARSWENPVDLGAGAQQAEVTAAVTALLAADEVDAVLTVLSGLLTVQPAATLSAIAVAAAARTPKPVVAVQIGGTARSVPLPGTLRAITTFTFPEAAAAALGAAHRYAIIRSAAAGEPVRADSSDPDRARALVADRLVAGAGWLDPVDVAALLDCYGIGPARPDPLAPDTASPAGPGLRTPAVIDPGPPGAGVELVAGVVQDPRFGPVVQLGAGGPLADLIADRQVGLAPLSIDGAAQIISALRIAPLLDGRRGRPPVSREAITTLLLGLATLADDLPEVAELDLDAVVDVTGLLVVGARARLAATPTLVDASLRQLGPPR